MALNTIEHKRHTLAHLLASAVLKQYPHALLTLGPAVDDGFYYDIDFSAGDKPGEDDFAKLEATMRELLPSWKEFMHEHVSAEEAKKRFVGNPYKLELIDNIASRGETITLYTVGPDAETCHLKPETCFLDLCRGGHCENPAKDIAPDSFMLDRIAGAYWRGDEKNAMLTRMYGLAFNTKKELDAYLAMREEAKKRDHRKLGKELGLFTLIDEIGPGLPLFYPKGATLRRLVEEYIAEEQEKRGYQAIWIPHITKSELYRISGHLDKYDAMFSPMQLDGEDYYLKPMNCPHFMMLYASVPHSYRELALRYTSTTTNYRYEKSGELSGLTRVRSLTQDDCHVFATPEQIEQEIDLMLEMIKTVYGTFGFDDFWVRVSLRDPNKKEESIGSDEAWEKAENALRSVVKKTGWKYEEVEGEAAFYGPKLDFIFKDVIGREWQLSTIQLDFNLPERFELEYTAEDGGKKRPVVIHRAILGSTERFLGILIEHYAGAFPLWLSPVQVKVLPVSEKHSEYASEVGRALKEAGIRVELDAGDESLGKRIRHAKLEKVPYLFVVGDKEIESETVMVESRTGNEGAHKADEVIKTLQEKIKNRA